MLTFRIQTRKTDDFSSKMEQSVYFGLHGLYERCSERLKERMRLMLILILISSALCSSLIAAETPEFETTVRSFAESRHELAGILSERLELPLPAEATKFFRVAATGDWDTVSNQFERLTMRNGYGTPISELRNALWPTIQEAFGVWSSWINWKENSSLLAMFHESVLSSMPKGSVYFGGTDDGRFIITAVNALKNPTPIFCITQNALRDATYVAYLRAHYGQDIWIPEEADADRAVQRYVEKVRNGKRPQDAGIKIVNGKPTVWGTQGVMAVNGILAGMIFEHNKDTHPFYLEESYAMDWMYPYLEPHGLIMKLNPQPLDKLSEQTVTEDRKFWDGYEQRLKGRPGFGDNPHARQVFSKLRSAIAGLYVFRKRYDEAGYAFQQAIRLYPGLPEASFGLAKMYADQKKITKAVEVIEAYLANNPTGFREQAEAYLKALKNSEDEVGVGESDEQRK